MLRRAAAVVAAFVLFNLIVIAAEAAERRAFPMPAVDLHDKAALAAAVAAMPMAALLLVLAGWALASLAAGAVAARISRRLESSLVVGGLGTAAGMMNNVACPPPTWFWALTLLTFIPAAFAGGRIALRAATQPAP